MSVKKSIVDRTRRLSLRQKRITALVAQGMKNHEIATDLGIATYVVRNYLTAIYDKIGVSNRVELALWYEARRMEGALEE
jgi:DNA-binding NarL/FixJ family response regulator